MFVGRYCWGAAFHHRYTFTGGAAIHACVIVQRSVRPRRAISRTMVSCPAFPPLFSSSYTPVCLSSISPSCTSSSMPRFVLCCLPFPYHVHRESVPVPPLSIDMLIHPFLHALLCVLVTRCLSLLLAPSLVAFAKFGANAALFPPTPFRRGTHLQLRPIYPDCTHILRGRFTCTRRPA